MYPTDVFPGTPVWWVVAVEEAIDRCGVAAFKWAIPLQAMGRYESNYNCAAGIARWVELGKPKSGVPIGAMQQGRNFYEAAWTIEPGRFPDHYVGDPVTSLVMAIMHIDSQLVGTSGGYGGIGNITYTDGEHGLLSRTDRGPGDVLRAWIADPDGFDVESARGLYEGY